MTLKEQITADMKNAMKAHDTAKLSAIRLLLAAVKQREVDERVEPTDDLVIGVISKLPSNSTRPRTVPISLRRNNSKST